MSRERAYRDACVVLAIGIAVTALACALLPMEKGDHARSLLDAARGPYGDGDRLLAVVAVLVGPSVFPLLTLVGPNKAVRIIGRVLAFPFVALLALGALLYVLQLGRRTYRFEIDPAWAALAIVAGLASAVAWVRSFFGGPWQAWAHVLVTPPAVVLSAISIVFAEKSARVAERLVGSGADVVFATVGVFVPVLFFVLFPRRATRDAPASSAKAL